MPDELNMDPFTRKYQGRHNAFLVRTNTAHLEACLAAVHTRRLRECAVRTTPEGDWQHD